MPEDGCKHGVNMMKLFLEKIFLEVQHQVTFDFYRGNLDIIEETWTLDKCNGQLTSNVQYLQKVGHILLFP